MYCGNCGKEIKDNRKFCPYCGNKSITQENVLGEKVADLTSRDNSKNAIFGMISLVLASVLLFRYYGTAFSRIEANKEAFYWVSNSAEMTGVMLHWLIPITPTVSYIGYLMECMKYKMNVKSGDCINLSIGMFFWGVMLWVGRTIYNDWSSSNDMSIVFYRIFSTYKELIGMTILFAIIVFSCGILIGKRTVN